MFRAVTTILFDLDGTLTDPRLGITRCIRYALKKMSQPAPEENKLLWCIGPPLLDSFDTLIGKGLGAAREAISHYRERFAKTGMFENKVYPGIPKMLESLSQRGFTLLVATSKPRVYANQILTHFNLKRYFQGIYGSTLKGGLTHKDELIPYLLNRERIPKAHAIMVGDREHDIMGAQRSGIGSIGVTYGYGSRAELVKARADKIVNAPEEILEILRDYQR